MERRREASLQAMLRRVGNSRAAGGWLALLMLAGAAWGQSCSTGEDFEAPARAGLEAAAHKYFALAAKGDVAGLKESAIPSVAEAFSGIAGAVQENQAAFAKALSTVKAIYLLTTEGSAPLDRAEFLCGVFGKSGQTASSSVFVLNGLQPGRYGVAILDVTGDDGRYAVSFVLQDVTGEWRLGGYYVKPTLAAGHDSGWFADQARGFAAKGQKHNAWFYFLQARNLATLVPFLSTRETDRLYDEMQKVASADAPEGFPVELAGVGRTYKIKSMFAYGVAGEVNLVVKYEAADVSDTVKTFTENQSVVRALVGKWPELRDGFGAIVARATEASGRDFGTLVQMKELK